jgi:hypothetical protein
VFGLLLFFGDGVVVRKLVLLCTGRFTLLAVDAQSGVVK